MSLVKKLNGLIAARLGIAETEVTDSLIKKRRAARKTDHDSTNSVVGGRTTDGLEHLSTEQVASALREFHRMATGDHK